MLDLTNRKPISELEKLPKATNDNLKLLFKNVDAIVIKEGGVDEFKALKDNVLLMINDVSIVEKFAELLEIDEANSGFYCLCLGTYAIELYSNGTLKTTIGFHHNVSFRYNGWNGDALLAKNEDFIVFLSNLGFEKPLQDWFQMVRNSEESKIEEQNWLHFAPLCFTKYWQEINDPGDEYFQDLMKDFNEEIPNRQQQIIILLQVFGRTKNFWTDYFIYEELPNTILKTYAIKDIIETYLNSDRNNKTTKGLGRFLCSYDFKKVRKNYLDLITDEVIKDLEKCFNHIGEKKGINEIHALKYTKNNLEKCFWLQ